MSTLRSETAKSRPLEILGISETEERVYRWLLGHSGATASETARALALTPAKAQRLLDAIEIKSLVTHSPERPRRYIPISPDISLEALALEHQENLKRARNTIQELREQAASAQPHSEQEQTIELIAGREAQRLIIEQIDRTARHEIIALTRSPMLISRLELSREQDQFTQKGTRVRGVRFRSIVDWEYLALPGAVHRAWEDMKIGEDIKVYPHLPIKMVLADRRVAVIPLSLQQTGSPVLLVRSSALLDALYALFEILWERAAPISFTREGIMETSTPASLLPKNIENLVTLMSIGLNDKKIAAELHIHVRTLRRHVAELMEALGARTRFQAGWLAALHHSEQPMD